MANSAPTLYSKLLSTGDKKLAAELEEVYGDMNTVDLYVIVSVFFMEKTVRTSSFGNQPTVQEKLLHPTEEPNHLTIY